MNKSKEVKVITYIRNSVKAGVPKDLIRDGIKKSFSIDDSAVDAVFNRQDMKKELEKLAFMQASNPVITQEQAVEIKKVKPEPKPEPPIPEPEPVKKTCMIAPVYSAGTPGEYGYKYYRKFLNLTDNIEENISILQKFYIERMGSNEPIDKIKETLFEYVRIFDMRGLDGADIVADRISMVARKAEPSKHSLNYLVGCLRNVMLYGLASINPKVDEFLMSTFRENFGVDLSESGKNHLLGMVSLYGFPQVIMTISKKTIRMENLILCGLETLLRDEEVG